VGAGPGFTQNRFAGARQRDGGFTLVELLVVLMIVGLSAGLVGPAIFKTYRHFQALIERERIDEQLELASWRAFFRREERRVTISRDRMTVAPDNLVLYFRYPPESPKIKEIVINREGLVTNDFKLAEPDRSTNPGG